MLSARQYLNQPKDDAIIFSGPPRWDLADVDHKTQNTVFQIPCFVSSGPCYLPQDVKGEFRREAYVVSLAEFAAAVL